MGYLSLYKTLSEHGADNSRLTPNISLITDENKLILTTKNNLNMTFNNINVVETTDEMTNNIILNKFPSITLTSMPGLKIYTDNSFQSIEENIKLYNAAQQFRNNYIIYKGWSDTGQDVYMLIDSLILNNKTIDEYDGDYNYGIEIYNNRIVLFAIGGSDVLTIYSDGSVSNVDLPTLAPNYTGTPDYTETPDYTYIPDIDTTSTTSTETPDTTSTTSKAPNYTGMPISIYTDNSDQSKAKNIKFYNDAIKWRKDYISNNGLDDTGQLIKADIDSIIIDNIIVDDYHGYLYYNYNICIYNDHITLITLLNAGQEILIIFSDGYVQFLFNKFPSNTSTNMPSMKIYTDNTDQSKSKNVVLYNNAQEWRKDNISYNGWSDTGQYIEMMIDQLVINNTTIDKYDNNRNYFIRIYKDRIILLNYRDRSEVLTISSDGSVTQTVPIPN